jgi:hypothetical protein
MKFSKLVEHVSKKPIPPHVTHFVVEVMASDEDEEDVEVHLRDRCPVSLPTKSEHCTGPVHRRAQVGLGGLRVNRGQ